MLKFLTFIIILLTLSARDISAMRRERLRREIVPYAILAAAAGIVALLSFAEDTSIMGGMLRLIDEMGGELI